MTRTGVFADPRCPYGPELKESEIAFEGTNLNLVTMTVGARSSVNRDDFGEGAGNLIPLRCWRRGDCSRLKIEPKDSPIYAAILHGHLASTLQRGCPVDIRHRAGRRTVQSMLAARQERYSAN